MYYKIIIKLTATYIHQSKLLLQSRRIVQWCNLYVMHYIVHVKARKFTIW